MECKTTLQPAYRPAYFASCVCQDPPPVDTGHVGLREIERAVCEREKRGWFKRKYGSWKVVEVTQVKKWYKRAATITSVVVFVVDFCVRSLCRGVRQRYSLQSVRECVCTFDFKGHKHHHKKQNLGNISLQGKKGVLVLADVCWKCSYMVTALTTMLNSQRHPHLLNHSILFLTGGSCLKIICL